MIAAMRRQLIGSIVIGMGAIAAQPLCAQNLNIDLGAVNGTPSSSYAAASFQDGTWNTLVLGLTSNLLGLDGAVTTASATVATAAGGANGSGFGCNPAGDVSTLITDFIYSTGGWSVTLTGLSNGTYTLYLYNPTHPTLPSGEMLVNGASVAALNGHGCTFILGSNYTTSSVEVTDGSITVVGIDPGQTGLSGLQLTGFAPAPPPPVDVVPVPAVSPLGLSLLVLVLAGFGCAHWFRRA